jgi:hypothetical protein
MPTTFQDRYFALVAEIERDFRVAQWKRGDVDIWPLARMDLFLDMHWRHTGQSTSPSARSLRRIVALLAMPFTNVWKSRHDLRHWTALPFRAHAVLLGDGVSLDLVGDAWQDRFGESLVAEFERQGLRTFVMQPGDLSRLPWRRPTFAANLVDVWARIARRADPVPASLPDLEDVNAYLRKQGIEAPSLARAALERRAAAVSKSADAFVLILRIVRPKLAFVVTYYAGLGPAFLVACRRLGILSVDLQHCPQDGAHKAYVWSNLPNRGFSTVPAVFWTWNKPDADRINRWAGPLPEPWHQGQYGGNTQLVNFCGGVSSAWEKQFRAVAGDQTFAREILVALQPIAGQLKVWEKLALTIEAAPVNWRWWIRRHPSSRAQQDTAFGRLLALRGDNIVIEPASRLPLPALLPHMTLLVSLMSGAAGEAAIFGVPAFFLSEEANGPFGELIARRCARVVEPAQLIAEIETLSDPRPGCPDIVQPDLGETLHRLEMAANTYRALVIDSRSAQRGVSNG